MCIAPIFRFYRPIDKIYNKNNELIAYSFEHHLFEPGYRAELEKMVTSPLRAKKIKRKVDCIFKIKEHRPELRHILRMIGEYKNRLNWQNFLNESIERFKMYKNLIKNNEEDLQKVTDKINRYKKLCPKFLHSWFDKHVAPRILEREYHPSPVYYTDTNGVCHDLTEMQ